MFSIFLCRATRLKYSYIHVFSIHYLVSYFSKKEAKEENWKHQNIRTTKVQIVLGPSCRVRAVLLLKLELLLSSKREVQRQYRKMLMPPRMLRHAWTFYCNYYLYEARKFFRQFGRHQRLECRAKMWKMCTFINNWWLAGNPIFVVNFCQIFIRLFMCPRLGRARSNSAT